MAIRFIDEGSNSKKSTIRFLDDEPNSTDTSAVSALLGMADKAQPTSLSNRLTPSSLLRDVGVASANAPGATSLLLAGSPFGNPTDIPNALMNLKGIPGQVKNALTRVSQVQGGAPLNPNEKGPAYTGMAVGTGLEMMAPTKSKAVENVATSLTRRGLGASKAALKTPFARGQATQAAKVALEEGVVPFLGNPQTAFDRASSLASKSGQRIGERLKQAPAEFSQAFDDLEGLRKTLTKGTKEGVFKGAGSKIDEVQKTIIELIDTPNPSAQLLNSVKTRIAGSLNYLADLASQSDNKFIVATIGNTIRKSVKAVTSPVEYAAFLKDQKIYGAAKSMMKTLNPEVAAQMGNNLITPTGTIVGATQAMTGNLPAAAASLGLTELLKRRGNLAVGRSLYELNKSRPAINPLANRLIEYARKNKSDEKYKSGR